MRASFLDSLGMSTNAAVNAIGSPRKSSTSQGYLPFAAE